MAKSMIYITSINSQTMAVGDTVNLGSTARRFGCNIRQNGNYIQLNGNGYYKITAVFTYAPTAAGTATVTMYDGGNAITGAKASATTGAGAEQQSLVIESVIRVRCDGIDHQISFQVSGAAGSMSNVSIVVEKM